MPAFSIVAQLRARPDRADALGHALAGLAGPTRAEPGCLRYDVYRDRDAPALFHLVEDWTGDDALAAHFETDHFAAYDRGSDDLLAEPLVYRRLIPLDVAGA